MLDTTRIGDSAHGIYPGALGKYADGYGDGQVESRHEKHEHRDNPDKAGSAESRPNRRGMLQDCSNSGRNAQCEPVVTEPTEHSGDIPP